MAHFASGTFFGYRAPELALARRRARDMLMGKHRWPLRLRLEELDLLSPSYEYVVFSGVASDDYPASFVDVGSLSTKIHCRIWDNPAQVVLSYDGNTALPEEYTEQGFHKLKMARGFMIRNFAPGNAARYQLVFY